MISQNLHNVLKNIYAWVYPHVTKLPTYKLFKQIRYGYGNGKYGTFLQSTGLMLTSHVWYFQHSQNESI